MGISKPHMKNIKKEHIIILILILAVAITIFFIWKNYGKDEPRAVQKEVILEEVVKEINNAYKMAMLLSGKEKEEEMAKAAPKSLKAWEEFVSAFKDKQPEAYRRTRNWDRKLLEILEHERKADELVKENRLREAQIEMEASRKMFKKIKEENNILNISEEMVALYGATKKVVAANNKEETLENMRDFKLKFTILKAYNIDEEYNQLLFKLEKLIGNIDKLLDGPDFRKAQSELEPVFLELYMEY